MHGLDTAAQFGAAAEELPCAVLETAPGDIIFMHNSLYHTVLGEHVPNRSAVAQGDTVILHGH